MTAPPSRTDGRTARTDRTRESIVDAHLSLIRDGDLKPTGERIAERAGISLRTLWVSFKDLEALFEASGVAVLAQERAAHRPIDLSMSLNGRIEAFCTQRAALLNLLAPQARAARIRAPFSQTLRRNLSRHVQLVRQDLDVTFAAEFATMSLADRAEIQDALLAATTWAAWSFLRDDLGHSNARATAVMIRSVTALLTSTQQPTTIQEETP